MKLLKMQSGQHQCLLFSMAMLLDEDPDVLIQEIGHDGMVVVWPEYSIPYCYNGHHIQEMQDVCLKRGKGLVPIEMFPRFASVKDPTDWRGVYDPESTAERFLKLIKNKEGILISPFHAYAWDGNIAYDPNGHTTEIQEIQVVECWLLAITSGK